jgi:hypothetical protein
MSWADRNFARAQAQYDAQTPFEDESDHADRSSDSMLNYYRRIGETEQRKESKRMTITYGSRVMIYEDPITKQKPEGEAFLREMYRGITGGGRFRVEFVDEPGQFYERDVLTDEKIDFEETKDSCGRWKD